MNHQFTTPVYLIPWKSSTVILYAPIKQIALATDVFVADIVNKVFAGAENWTVEENVIIDALHELSILDSEVDILDQLEDLAEYLPTTVHLDITPTCNMGCIYCYADAKPQPGTMPYRLAQKAVDLICINAVKTNSKSIRIVFLGSGEPLARWNQLVRIIEYAESQAAIHKLNLQKNLTTNGTLITEARAKWFKAHGVFVSVSFDGLPELQNRQRPMANGKKSLPMLQHGIANLVESNANFGIRTTVTAESVENVSSIVEYVNEAHFGKKLDLELVGECGRSTETLNSANDLAVSLIKARHLGRAFDINVTSSIARALTLPRTRFCQIEFAVSHKGEVSACHRFLKPTDPNYHVFSYGYFDLASEEFVFDIDKLNIIRSRGAFQYDDCQTCFARWNCAGDCLALRTTNGEVGEHGARCSTIRSTLRSQLADKLGLLE